MPPFRFNIPFFSYRSPSRPSSGTSSPSPPSTPPTPSRPPFRPGGIAQPSKPATSLETKPKSSPSLSRAKSNVAAIAASSSASQLPSRDAATPTRLAKQNNQSGSPLKKPESLRTEEQKVAMKDKPSREAEKEAGKNINPVVDKPLVARSEQKEVEEAQKQRKKREVEKLAVVERDSKTAREQQKSKETEKLAAEEKKKVLRKDIEDKSKTTQGTDQLAVGENKEVIRKDMEENLKTAQEQHRIKETEQTGKETERTRKETEKLAVEENKKVLRKDMEESSKAAQGQQKGKETEKLSGEERNTALKTVGREDATQDKTTRHTAPASESTRGSKDLPDGKTQNRTEIHTNDNHQKAKGEVVSNHGNPRVTNREGSSSMSRRIKEDIRDGISKLTWGKSNGDEKSVSVFTLTGENRGATMAIGSEKDKKDGEVHIHRGYRSNPDESPDTTATETEGGTRPFNGKNPKDVEEDARVRAYVNGNSQGVNNSIICDSSVQQNDPGIHMNMKFQESKKDNETVSPVENVAEKKPETVKETEKLRSEPRVRRRCLRGLLAESSESEPENPMKPRRHGCRFTCKDKDIENT